MVSLLFATVCASATPLSTEAQEPTASQQESVPNNVLGLVHPGKARVPDAEADAFESITSRTPLTVGLWSPDGQRALRFGMLLSLDYVYAGDPELAEGDGFLITDARVVLTGELARDWSYEMSGDFARAGAGLIDLQVRYAPEPWLTVWAGRFKVPVSAELLVPDADLDLIRLARVVAAVAPGRSLGVQVLGRLPDRVLFWRAGVFGGTPRLDDDGSGPLLAGRVGARIPTGPGEEGRLTVGLNGARSWNDRDLSLRPFDAPFSGRRLVVGADLRGSWGPVSLAGELLVGRFEPAARPDAGEPGALGRPTVIDGAHLTAILRLTSFAAVLLRWDRLRDGRPETPRDLLIPSVTAVIPEVAPVSFQFDARIPVEDAGRSTVIGNATLAF